MSCFTTIYPALADYLQQQLPAGVWIDLDQEQLQPENEALDYPLPYAEGVVLISFDEVDWQELGGGVQAGEAVIRFTLARQVVQDTYTVAGQQGAQRAAAMQQLSLLSQLHRALQHYAIGEAMGALVRVYSRKEAYSKPGLWVYSLGYKARLYDTEGHPVANVATVPALVALPGARPPKLPFSEGAAVILP